MTLDRNSYPLPDNFFVIATQNPHDFEGTYPLPESQIDRFLLRMDMGYLQPGVEQQVLKTYDHPGGGHDVDFESIEVLDVTLLVQARDQAARVHVAEGIYQYVIDIAGASRNHPQVSLGLSTRGSLGVMRCARAEAALRGGEFVTPDDVKAVLKPVMTHRLVLAPEAVLEGIEADDVVDAIVGQINVPRGQTSSV